MFAIETQSIVLTTWEPEDWQFVHALASDPEVVRFIGHGLAWTDDRAREFVSRQIANYVAWGTCLWKMFLLPGREPVGFCGIQPLEGTREFEIGWWLAREHWGKGLSTEAARAALHDGFQRVGLARVVSVAVPENDRSIRVMKKLGMSFERGTTHKGVPVVLYSIARPETP